MRFNPRTREVTIAVDDLYSIAEALVSEDGENPEYDRGIYEFLCDTLQLSSQDGGRELVESQILVARHYRTLAKTNPCD